MRRRRAVVVAHVPARLRSRRVPGVISRVVRARTMVRRGGRRRRRRGRLRRDAGSAHKPARGRQVIERREVHPPSVRAPRSEDGREDDDLGIFKRARTAALLVQ
eukprot:31019-Pelagococcus_subviridis.AAC.4